MVEEMHVEPSGKYCVNCKHLRYSLDEGYRCYNDNNKTNRRVSGVSGLKEFDFKYKIIRATRDLLCKGDWFEQKESVWKKLKMMFR